MKRIADEAEKILASGALGRSSQLGELFAFLVANAEQTHSPKESEIADRVFGRSSDFDPSQDTLVRVHVHRLRGKIDQYYTAHPPLDGQRLRIPRGEYRLALGQMQPPVDEVRARRVWPWRKLALALGVLCVLLAMLALWQFAAPRWGSGSSLPLWGTLRDDARTELVIVGDRFVFAETDPASGRTRLLRDQDITSGDEFDEVRLLNPKLAERVFNPQVTDLPVGVATALRFVMPAITDDEPERQRVRLLPMSQVTPDMLRVANTVYIGHLSDIGFLGDPLLAASRVVMQQGGLRLVDRKTGKVLAQAPSVLHPGPRSEDDFGYIASFGGPAGNRVVVISGGGNVGLMQAAEIAASPRRLAALTRTIGGANGDFEAVLQVSSLHNLNVGSRPVLVAPLSTAAIWHNAGDR